MDCIAECLNFKLAASGCCEPLLEVMLKLEACIHANLHGWPSMVLYSQMLTHHVHDVSAFGPINMLMGP
jgi:hypothetical protein